MKGGLLLLVYPMLPALNQWNFVMNVRADCWIDHQYADVFNCGLLLPQYPRNDGLAFLQIDFPHLQPQVIKESALRFLSHWLERIVDSIKLLGREVINVEPIIIPRVSLGLPHLFVEALIGEVGEARDVNGIAALDNRLAFTEDGEVAVGAVPHSKLLSGADYVEELAIPNEDTGLAGSYEYITVLALVDIDAGSRIEQIDVALLAI